MTPCFDSGVFKRIKDHEHFQRVRVGFDTIECDYRYRFRAYPSDPAPIDKTEYACYSQDITYRTGAASGTRDLIVCGHINICIARPAPAPRSPSSVFARIVSRENQRCVTPTELHNYIATYERSFDSLPIRWYYAWRQEWRLCNPASHAPRLRRAVKGHAVAQREKSTWTARNTNHTSPSPSPRGSWRGSHSTSRIASRTRPCLSSRRLSIAD